jgi:hypothetical protein
VVPRNPIPERFAGIGVGDGFLHTPIPNAQKGRSDVSDRRSRSDPEETRRARRDTFSDAFYLTSVPSSVHRVSE